MSDQEQTERIQENYEYMMSEWEKTGLTPLLSEWEDVFEDRDPFEFI
jgi:hypothetical protein